MKGIKTNISAISEIMGVVLLFGLTIALFSVLYLSMPINESNSNIISSDIIAYTQGEYIILEHHGGESLSKDVFLSFNIGGNITTSPVNGEYLQDSNNNDKWDLGEKIQFQSSFDEEKVQTSVINQAANSLIFSATLQEGISSSETNEIITSVNQITPYLIVSSPLPLTAQSTGSVPQEVSLYYQYSSDNNSWPTPVEYATDSSSPWEWSFSFPDGNGFYQFYSIGSSGGNIEDAPSQSDTSCHFIQSDSSAIAQWQFNENSGSIAFDSIANNDGSVTGATWTSGVDESALSFDGIDDFVKISDDAIFDLSDSLSIEAWVNPSGDGMVLGEISDGSIDSDVFGNDGSEWAKGIIVDDDTLAIVFQDWNDDGWIRTVQIQSDGTISDPDVDSLEFDDSNGREPDIIHISSDIYAIAYRGDSSDGMLKTIRIRSNGLIDYSIIDSFEFDSSSCYYPEIIHISGEIYAIVYQSNGNDGMITTVEINSDGSIENSVIERYEFDSTGREPDIIPVSDEVYAVVYKGPGNDGYIKTIQIQSNGDIGSSYDTLEFDTSEATYPKIIHIANDVYAITYAYTWWNGYVKTVSILDDGTIADTILDEFKFEDNTAMYCDITHVTRNIYAISFLGPGSDGFVITLQINPDGTIIKTITDSLEFDTQSGYFPTITKITNEVLALTYTNSQWRGIIKTVTINDKHGIFKAGSYGIDFTHTNAYGFINDHVVSTSIQNGWNHLVLTYDKDESIYQQKLYVNGIEMVNASYTANAVITETDLYIGYHCEAIIDEVSIYDFAVSSNDVLTLYQQYSP